MAAEGEGEGTRSWTQSISREARDWIDLQHMRPIEASTSRSTTSDFLDRFYSAAAAWLVVRLACSSFLPWRPSASRTPAP